MNHNHYNIKFVYAESSPQSNNNFTMFAKNLLIKSAAKFKTVSSLLAVI